MDEIQEALNYIFSNIPPSGEFKEKALEMHKELQDRKLLRYKKKQHDYRAFKGDMIRKSTRKKLKNLYSYGKVI